jgi:hypothetical protein
LQGAWLGKRREARGQRQEARGQRGVTRTAFAAVFIVATQLAAVVARQAGGEENLRRNRPWLWDVEVKRGGGLFSTWHMADVA